MALTPADIKIIDQAILDEDWKKALKLSTQWISDEPERAPAWGAYARIQGILGKHDIATEAIDKAIALDPNNPAYLYKSGSIHMNAKRFDQAEKSFDRSIEASILNEDAVSLDAARLARMKCLLLLNRERDAQKVMAAPYRPESTAKTKNSP